jgi:hypothetical protein
LADLSRQLIEEIRSQRDLMYAETGDLAVNPEPMPTGNVLESPCAFYTGQSFAPSVAGS